jgi:hypothetical protein
MEKKTAREGKKRTTTDKDTHMNGCAFIYIRIEKEKSHINICVYTYTRAGENSHGRF